MKSAQTELNRRIFRLDREAQSSTAKLGRKVFHPFDRLNNDAHKQTNKRTKNTNKHTGFALEFLIFGTWSNLNSNKNNSNERFFGSQCELYPQSLYPRPVPFHSEAVSEGLRVRRIWDTQRTGFERKIFSWTALQLATFCSRFARRSPSRTIEILTIHKYEIKSLTSQTTSVQHLRTWPLWKQLICELSFLHSRNVCAQILSNSQCPTQPLSTRLRWNFSKSSTPERAVSPSSSQQRNTKWRLCKSRTKVKWTWLNCSSTFLSSGSRTDAVFG